MSKPSHAIVISACAPHLQHHPQRGTGLTSCCQTLTLPSQSQPALRHFLFPFLITGLHPVVLGDIWNQIQGFIQEKTCPAGISSERQQGNSPARFYSFCCAKVSSLMSLSFLPFRILDKVVPCFCLACVRPCFNGQHHPPKKLFVLIAFNSQHHPTKKVGFVFIALHV